MTDERAEAIAKEVRRLQNKRRRDLAHAFLEAWRGVREETGYGGIQDAVVWSQRIVEGRDE